MKLENNICVVTENATEFDIANVVHGMTEVGKSFIILSQSDEWYLQACGTYAEGGFIIERRDGCAGEHFRGGVRIDHEDLMKIFVGYLLGRSGWDVGIAWVRVDLDTDADHGTPTRPLAS